MAKKGKVQEVGSLRVSCWCRGWFKSCKVVFLWRKFLFTCSCRHFCYRMFRLAPVHFVTDRQTDKRNGRTDSDNSRS